MKCEMDREKDERSEMTCQMNMKGSPRARRHQPIGESQANSSSRLGEVEAEVVCCGPVPAGHSPTQPPGSCPPPTRVATHGKRVAPISRLLRHAGGYSVPIRSPAPQGVHLVASYDMQVHSGPILDQRPDPQGRVLCWCDQL